MVKATTEPRMRVHQLLAVFLITPALGTTVRAQDYRYAVIELPTLGGDYSYGWTLDDAGNVVGSSFVSGNRDFHAALWRQGRPPLDLGTLGGEDSSARGINENGWIVGRAKTSNQTDFDFSAFLWRNGQMINLGYLGTGDFAEAYGINHLNQVVGRSAIDHVGSTKRAFLWQDGEMVELARTPDNPSTEAIAINNAGLIVGQAWSNEWTTWRPVIWENGGIVDLGTFRFDNGGDGVCIDVNEAGDVVGYTSRDFETNQAFIYHNGRMRRLPEKPRWTNSFAWSINDNRQIVGACRTKRTGVLQDVGCIWEWEKPVEYLNDLIPPKSNWFIGLAIHNNDAGQITGNGFRLDDRDHTKGYLLSPVHPSMELSDLIPGVANADNTLTVTGVTPGARVTFLYSRHGGGTRIPGCDLQQNALQLDNPTVIATAVANQQGVATITRPVPLIARGQTILFQAVVQNQCAISQLVVHQFD